MLISVFSNWYPRRDLNPYAVTHYHLKVACLPIPPPGHYLVPKTGLEPVRRYALPPQGSVSTNSTTWAKLLSLVLNRSLYFLSFVFYFSFCSLCSIYCSIFKFFSTFYSCILNIFSCFYCSIFNNLSVFNDFILNCLYAIF